MQENAGKRAGTSEGACESKPLGKHVQFRGFPCDTWPRARRKATGCDGITAELSTTRRLTFLPVLAMWHRLTTGPTSERMLPPT